MICKRVISKVTKFVEDIKLFRTMKRAVKNFRKLSAFCKVVEFGMAPA